MNAKMIESLSRAIEKWHNANVVGGDLKPSPYTSSRTFEMMATASVTILEALRDYQDEAEAADK